VSEQHTYRHSPACYAAHTRWEEEMRQFEGRYPDYCRTCGGAGYTCYEYDPSPPGVSLSPGTMTDCDPCPDCEEQGKCGVCKAELGPDEDECERVCGCSHDIIAPPEPECFCWDDRSWQGDKRFRFA
jgi:hypothetical protein